MAQKPLFLEEFEAIFKTLTVLAAQEPRPFPEKASVEAQAHIARELYANTVQNGSVLREALEEFGRALNMAQDLTLATEPDVERFAFWILAASYARAPQNPIKPADAESAARGWLDHRQKMRAGTSQGPQAAAKVTPGRR